MNWHLIGHLQRNKVKYIIGRVCMIHSVDSLRLAQEIQKEADKHQVSEVPVLVEVNIGNEESKDGVSRRMRRNWCRRSLNCLRSESWGL